MRAISLTALVFFVFSASSAAARCDDDTIEGKWDFIAIEHIPVEESGGAEFSTSDYCALTFADAAIDRVSCVGAATDAPDIVEGDLEGVDVLVASNCRITFEDNFGFCEYFATISEVAETGSGVAQCADGTRIGFDLVKR